MLDCVAKTAKPSTGIIFPKNICLLKNGVSYPLDAFWFIFYNGSMMVPPLSLNYFLSKPVKFSWTLEVYSRISLLMHEQLMSLKQLVKFIPKQQLELLHLWFGAN